MANFYLAFEKMIRNEGGYQLVNVLGDRGGQTFAGISRRAHPDWEGWRFIDNRDLPVDLVPKFYMEHYWRPICGDEIAHQAAAEAIFDFAVNAGVKVAVTLAQLVVGIDQDGRIGPATLAKIDAADEAVFVLKYALAKVARYAEICNRDREQSKFLLGWINRTVKGLV